MKEYCLETFRNEDEVREVVKKIASKINSDYKDRRPVLVCVLGGSFIFLSDLVRELATNVEIDFVKAGSYGGATRPERAPCLTLYPSIDLKGRDVIIVEDIIDTAATYIVVSDAIKSLSPASITCCTLLYRRGAPVKPEYKGFDIESGFLVGYGLDFNEEYRALKSLYILKEKQG